MYCIIVTGIPASGKTTFSEYLSEYYKLPVFSKDKIKEVMYDDIGFESRAEKIKLGVASMNIMYYAAEQLMKINKPFILENNFENISKDGLMKILAKYSYAAITITLTGDYKKIYIRFLERDASSERHRGHVVNDCYPEKEPRRVVKSISYEKYEEMITTRGMDEFVANGPHIVVDTSNFEKVDMEEILNKITKSIGEFSNE